MPKQYFLSNSDGGKAQAFEQLRDNVSAYIALLSLNLSDITQQATDAGVFRALVNFAKSMRDEGSLWVAWKDFMRDGPKVGHPTPPAPTVPAVPSVLSSGTPLAGIVARFLLLANAIKNHKNYTVAIGLILGLEGSEQTGPDMSTVKPDISAKVVGDHVAIKWGWQGFSAFLDMLELQVDRGTGAGYVLLTYDTTPDYNDTAPLPTTPTHWKYRAIFRVGDARVGVWSDEVTILVGA